MGNNFLIRSGFFFLFILLVPANAAEITPARRDFRIAWEALTRGDFDTLADLLPNLTDFPLYGYLVHGELNARIESATDKEIKDFLRRYSNLPVAAAFRAGWLKRLAGEERWEDFLANYQESEDLALRCLYAQAQIGLRDQQSRTSEESLPPPDSAWMSKVRDLWMVNKAQPDECEGIFRIWREAGGMTPADLWQRINLVFDAGKVDLAEELGRRLPAGDRSWVQAWARVHRNPRSGLEQPLLNQDTSRARRIIVYGLSRLARDNPTTAMGEWRRLKGQYAFDRWERAQVERSIALRAALNRDANALPWLEAIDAPNDAEVRRARVRAALWAENWPAAARYIRQLRPWERAADRWQYWEARALEKTAQPGANEIYRTLAGHRGYHGFLAADHIGAPYAFNHRPVVAVDLKPIADRPAFARAHEWFILGYFPEGRKEWMAGLAGNSPAELIAAAQLAAQWNWPDRIIATIGKSPEEDDLILRFPLAYRKLITEYAAAANISPATVFAITRQESVFMSDIRSPAGALGLMQLMPSTAAQVARNLQISFNNTNLLEPDYNLRLGSVFLAQLIKRFGNLTLAAAAYNAGPGRIQQWRPRAQIPADIWIESIPFDETRRYVRNILTYKAIYGWRLNLSQERLTAEMPVINP